MVREEAYRRAKEKIDEAWRSGAKELSLSAHGENTLKLSKLPNSLSRLTELQTLDLSGNRLTELPRSFARLKRQEFLWVHSQFETEY